MSYPHPDTLSLPLVLLSTCPVTSEVSPWRHLHGHSSCEGLGHLKKGHCVPSGQSVRGGRGFFYIKVEERIFKGHLRYL